MSTSAKGLQGEGRKNDKHATNMGVVGGVSVSPGSRNVEIMDPISHLHYNVYPR